ncbi:uncharacterized protein LOC129598926 [Paramacrobiotus metropolitanus]|uniref:uncharacterized protein LOC129598926 n=1 Tax=Paramacrobiotus metropolitanus TaxID=2943436 RepID=UPI0024457522|nr:uncharacterized protein LOC129598926 [Paramacrobiotus metropolitanus]
MYLYEDGTRSVQAWNAVDVEIDGLFQHGHIVGLEESVSIPPRLIIDFGCSTQQSVPVDNVKVFTFSTFPSFQPRQEAVEVLLFDHPGRPWKWYPGKVLINSFANLRNHALVEVTVGGQHLRELLPNEQIRPVSSEKRLQRKRVQPGDFVMRTCRVPNGYWVLTECFASKLLRHIQRRFRVRFTYVFGQEMHYIQQHTKSPLEDATIAKVFERKKLEFIRNGKFLVEDSRRLEGPDQEKRSDTKWRGWALPTELFEEVFQSLDTIDRQRCRRSSSTFLPAARQKWNDCYAAYGCFFKHITSAARTICIRDTEWDCDDQDDLKLADGATTLMQKLLHEAGIRIERLIVHHRSLTIDQGEPGPLKLQVVFAAIAALHSKLASCCDRLIWRRYSLNCENSTGAIVLEFRVPITMFNLGGVGAPQIWDTFEQHLRCTGPALDMDRIAQWMARCTHRNARTKRFEKILNDFQSCDPRPSANFRGDPWTVGAMTNLDVHKLNTLCLHVLWHFVQKWNRTSSDDATDSSGSSESDPEDSSDSEESSESDSHGSDDTESTNDGSDSNGSSESDSSSEAESNDTTDSDF